MEENPESKLKTIAYLKKLNHSSTPQLTATTRPKLILAPISSTFFLSFPFLLYFPFLDHTSKGDKEGR